MIDYPRHDATQGDPRNDPKDGLFDDPLIEPGARPFWARPAVKGLALLIFLLSALYIIYGTPLKSFLDQTEMLSQWFKSHGLFGVLAYIAMVTAMIGVGVPRLLLCSIGGLIFGFWSGLLLTQLGSMLGSYCIFLLVRYADWNFGFLRKRPSLDKFQGRIGKGGIMSVFSIRMMPLSGFYSTIMMAMLPIRHRNFLLGTLLGSLPQGIPATLIGSGASQETLQTSIAYIVVAVVAFIAAWVFIDIHRKKMRNHAGG